jgi:hypothetical protein
MNEAIRNQCKAVAHIIVCFHEVGVKHVSYQEIFMKIAAEKGVRAPELARNNPRYTTEYLGEVCYKLKTKGLVESTLSKRGGPHAIEWHLTSKGERVAHKVLGIKNHE